MTQAYRAALRGSLHRLFEKFFQIRPDEFKLVQAFFLYLATIGMFYAVGTTVGETLFLSRLGAETVERLLPWTYIGLAVATVAVTALYDRLAQRVSRIRLLVGAQLLLAASLLLFVPAAASGHKAVYFALVIWVEACNLFTLSLFFSFAGDYFTSHDARRLYGYMTGGLAVGIFAAGYAVEPLVGAAGTEVLLYACAAILAGGAGVAFWIARFARRLERPGEEEGGGAPLRAVAASPFLRTVFLLTLLCSVCTVLVDYNLNVTASRLLKEEEMAVFFGRFFGYMGAASVVVQFLLVGWLLTRFGIMVSLLVMPVLLVAANLAASVHPTLMAVAAANFILLTLAETLDMPAQELLFLPLSSRLRLRAQTLVDGVINPVGHGLAGVLLILLAFVGVRVAQVAGFVAALSVVWVAMIFVLRPRYRQVLAASLKERRLPPTDIEALLRREDGQAVLASLLDPARPELAAAALDLLRGRPLGVSAPAVARLACGGDELLAARAVELLGAAGAGQLAAIRAALQSGGPQVRAAAVAALCRAAGAGAGAEAAPYLDSREPGLAAAALVGLARHCGGAGARAARSRIAALLASGAAKERAEAARLIARIGPGPAAAGLERLLGDPDAGVRSEALRACRGLRDASLTGRLIALVDEPPFRHLAVKALEAMPPQAFPVLAAAVRDPGRGAGRRALLARVMGQVGGVSAVRPLWELLAPHEGLLLRLETGRALRRLRDRAGLPGLHPAGYEERLRLLAEAVALLQQARAEMEESDAAVFLADHAGLHQELILTLLALRYDSRQLQRIAAHIFGDNETLRANAVELLENVLPRSSARRLLPLLDGRSARGPAGTGLTAATARRLCEHGPWTRAIAAAHLRKTGRTDEASGGAVMDDQDTGLQKVLAAVSVLKQADLFKGVPADYLASLADIVSERGVYAGDKLFSEGDAGDCLYLVVSGRVRIFSGAREVAVMGPQECIGEMALLDGEPRSASAVVEQDGRVLRIASEDFRDLLADHPAMGMALLKTMAKRLRQTLAPGALASSKR